MPDPLEDFTHRALGAGDRARIDAAMVDVLDAFAAAGVDALVLKGPVIARWLYAEREVRGYSDCDILAAPDRFATAGRALEGAGFHSHGDEAEQPELREQGRSQIWHRLPDDVWVDLQWRLGGIGVAPDAAWECLWAERTTMDVGVAEVPVAGEAARALHLALVAATKPEARKSQLDLERGVARLGEATWTGAAALARRLDATRVMSHGLACAPGGAALASRLGIDRS